MDALRAMGEPLTEKRVRREMKKYLGPNAVIGADNKIKEQIKAYLARENGHGADDRSSSGSTLNSVGQAETPADAARILGAEVDRLLGLVAERTSERDEALRSLDACRDDLAKASADAVRAAERGEEISSVLAAAEADRAMLRVRLDAMEQELNDAQLTTRTLEQELLKTQFARCRQLGDRAARLLTRLLRKFRKILPAPPALPATADLQALNTDQISSHPCAH